MIPDAVRGAPVTYPLGTRRGLEACASPGGTFAVLALDHRQNLRKELRPDAPESVTYAQMVDFKRAVIRALAPHATGSLLDPEIGAAQCIADGSLPGRAGLLVAIPSMFGYNWLVHNLRVLTVEMDNFAQELVSHIETEYLEEEELV